MAADVTESAIRWQEVFAVQPRQMSRLPTCDLMPYWPLNRHEQDPKDVTDFNSNQGSEMSQNVTQPCHGSLQRRPEGSFARNVTKARCQTKSIRLRAFHKMSHRLGGMRVWHSPSSSAKSAPDVTQRHTRAASSGMRCASANGASRPRLPTTAPSRSGRGAARICRHRCSPPRARPRRAPVCRSPARSLRRVLSRWSPRLPRVRRTAR